MRLRIDPCHKKQWTLIADYRYGYLFDLYDCMGIYHCSIGQANLPKDINIRAWMGIKLHADNIQVRAILDVLRSLSSNSVTANAAIVSLFLSKHDSSNGGN